MARERIYLTFNYCRRLSPTCLRETSQGKILYVVDRDSRLLFPDEGKRYLCERGLDTSRDPARRFAITFVNVLAPAMDTTEDGPAPDAPVKKQKNIKKRQLIAA